MLLSTVLLFLILWFGAACLFMVKLGVTFTNRIYITMTNLFEFFNLIYLIVGMYQDIFLFRIKVVSIPYFRLFHFLYVRSTTCVA
jgi:hypothetical protein